MCKILCLASLTQHRVLEVHAVDYYNNTLFYYVAVFHFIKFVYILLLVEIWIVSSLELLRTVAVDIFV